MQLRRRKRSKLSKPTAIPGKRIDRAYSLMTFCGSAVLSQETKLTEVKDDNMIAELDEPNDCFRALDFNPPAKLPRAAITKPLSKDQRLLLLSKRAEEKRQLWHHAEEKNVPMFCYLQVVAVALKVAEVFDLPDDGDGEGE